MPKTLIIAEKPSVAGDIARVLGGFKKTGDYYESEDKIICSAIGHLVELFMPEDIDKNLKRWSLKNLPIIPEKFKLKASEKTKDRMALLKKLMGRDDVDSLINACDAGREGELIFTYIYELAKCKKPFKRLWFSSMTKQGITTAFEHLRSADQMQPLQDAARSRSESDWLIGINGTRAVTARMYGFKAVSTVGRVQTPTLALVVERENQIANFVSRDFWRITADFNISNGAYEGVYQKPKFKKGDDEHDRADRLWDEQKAQEILEAVKNATHALVSEEKKRTTQIAPRLYDLTTLQREANQRFGLPAGKTLQIAQALYEKYKVLTYPRTDSRALPEDYAGTCANVLQSMEGELGTHAREVLNKGMLNPKNKRIFNNAQVSDHFAIIPTGQSPDKLGDFERKIFDMVARRFVAAFFPVAEFDVTTRISEAAGHAFKTEGKVLVNPGWKAVYGKENNEEEATLPALSDADKDPPQAQIAEVRVLAEKTKPPARYTEATLLAAMEGAGKFVDDEELALAMKEKGLGTPATRASIIEHLLNLKYMEREERNLVPTAKAQDLITFLQAVKIDVLTQAALTGDWEFKLREMEQGKLSREDFMKGIREMTSTIVERTRNFTEDEGDAVQTDIPAPDGQLLLETLRLWRTPDSSFTVYKTIGNRKMDPEEVRALLRDGKIGPLDGFRSKMGRPFSAILQLNEENKVRFVFENNRSAEGGEATEQIDLESLPELCECPVCKKAQVVETPSAYVCRRTRAQEDRCTLRIGRKILGKVIPPEQAKKLLTEGKTDLLEGFRSNRTKRLFSAFLLLKKAGAIGFEFPPREAKPKAAAKAKKKKSNPLFFQNEAPGFLTPHRPCVIYSDTRRGFNTARRWRRSRPFKPQPALRQGRSFVERFVDAKGLGEFGRAVAGTRCANEHRRRVINFACDDVEHPVNTVTKVNIPMPGLAEHDTCARGFAFGRMRGLVGKTIVSLRLHDRQTRDFSIRKTPTQLGAQQRAGDFHGVAAQEIRIHAFLRSGHFKNRAVCCR